MNQKFRRAFLLILAVLLLTTCLSGCFTFSFPELLGGLTPDDTSGGPLFDPDGNDDPLTDAADATGASTLPTEKQDPVLTPTESETQPVQQTEPTQPPTEEPTQAPTQAPTQPADPQPSTPISYGVIIGDIVNVRRGPGTNYGVVRLAYEYDRIAIYEKRSDWGRIKDGWVHLDYVYIDGTVGPEGSIVGTVIGNSVNIRSGPGTNYAIVRQVNMDDELEVLYIGCFDDMYWGCTKYGWICTSYMYFGN